MSSIVVSSLLSGKITDEGTVETIAAPIRRVASAESIGYLSTVLEKESVALITNEKGTESSLDLKIATPQDILEFISQGE